MANIQTKRNYCEKTPHEKEKYEEFDLVTDSHILLRIHIGRRRFSHFQIWVLTAPFANNQQRRGSMKKIWSSYTHNEARTPKRERKRDCIKTSISRCSIHNIEILRCWLEMLQTLFFALSLHTKRKKLVVCVCVEKVPLKQRFQPSHDAKCNLSIFAFLFAGNIIQHQPLCIYYVSILSVCVCVNSFFLFVITFLLLFLRQHHHCHNHHHRNHLLWLVGHFVSGQAFELLQRH